MVSSFSTICDDGEKQHYTSWKPTTMNKCQATEANEQERTRVLSVNYETETRNAAKSFARRSRHNILPDGLPQYCWRRPETY